MQPGRCGVVAAASSEPSQAAPRPPHQQPHTPPQRSHTSRRTTLLSITGLAWGPGALLDSLRGEAALWQQEAELYKRKASEALTSQLGDAAATGSSASSSASASLRLDPSLAAALLAAPLAALQQQDGAAGGDKPPAAAMQLPALDMQRYQQDFQSLQDQELPYFQKAGSCGHCGTTAGPAALTDRQWFDFQSYLQYKALARQLGAALKPAPGSSSGGTTLSGWERMHAGSPEMQLRAAEQAWLASGQRQPLFGPGSIGAGAGGTPEQQLAAAAAAYRATGQTLPSRDGSGSGGGAPEATAADALRLAVGAAILEYAMADLERVSQQADSSSGGSVDGSGGSGSGSEPAPPALSAAERAQQAQRDLAALRNTGPELDGIRQGAQALLRYFVDRGYAAAASCEQLGLSLDEYENHYVWSIGEPAFLKYWLEAPATLRSSSALEQEEGFSQDFVAATLQAWFRRCGVSSSSLKRYASYSEPELVANQWTLRRVAPLPDGYDWQQYAQWAPDFCPLADEACY